VWDAFAMNSRQLQNRNVALNEEATIKVVVAYGDVTSALHAKRLIAHMTDDLGAGFRMQEQFWKFSVFESRQLWEDALREAAEADILCISACDNTELPFLAKAWIDLSVRQRKGQPGALVLLQGQTTARSAESLHAYLRRIAEEGAMDFFAPNNVLPPESVDLAPSQIVRSPGLTTRSAAFPGGE
jgi:hypothetical protein